MPEINNLFRCCGYITSGKSSSQKFHKIFENLKTFLDFMYFYEICKICAPQVLILSKFSKFPKVFQILQHSQYFTAPPHSIWNMFGPNMECIHSMDSIWIPHGMGLIFYTTITHSTLPAKIYEFNVYTTWNRHLSKVQGE